MSTVSNAVASYEAAVRDEGEAWDKFNASADVASKKVGGQFTFERGVGVMWAPDDDEERGRLGSDAVLVTHRRCPDRVKAAATALGALGDAIELAGDTWREASSAMLAAPRESVGDTLEKFKALAIETPFLEPDRAVKRALGAVRAAVEAAEGGAESSPA